MIKTNSSKYYQIETPEGPLHVHINYFEKNGEIVVEDLFLRLPPLGTELSTMTSLLGVFISRYLRNGGKIEDALKHLNSIKSGKKVMIDENTVVDSVPKGVALCLVDFKNTVVEPMKNKSGIL